MFNRLTLILLRFYYVLIAHLTFFLGYRQCLRPYNPVHTVYMNVMVLHFSFYLCYLYENKMMMMMMMMNRSRIVVVTTA